MKLMNFVEEYIERKSLLYKTKVEYGDYTINHVLGCSHGCDYPCYAYLMARRFGRVKNIEEWCNPKLVSNYKELLNEEILKLKDKIKSVHLCFSTDPFMYDYPEIQSVSLNIIRMLNENGIKCTALTKGHLPNALSEFDLENEFGITLISIDENFRKKMEPHSAPYFERISDLKYLHDKGVKTWVSIEPYPTPNIIEQNFGSILKEVSFVDKIIFGRLNYNKRVTEYADHKNYYNLLTQQVIDFCTENNIEYHIKAGTDTR